MMRPISAASLLSRAELNVERQKTTVSGQTLKLQPQLVTDHRQH